MCVHALGVGFVLCLCCLFVCVFVMYLLPWSLCLLLFVILLFSSFLASLLLVSFFLVRGRVCVLEVIVIRDCVFNDPQTCLGSTSWCVACVLVRLVLCLRCVCYVCFCVRV